MSIHRTAAKRDSTEPAIRAALEGVGASVYPLSGEDIPDLLVGFRGDTYLIEVKARKGKLTDGQRVFADDWRGGAVGTARTVDEALRLIGAIE